MSSQLFFAFRHARYSAYGLFICVLLLSGCASVTETSAPGNLIDYALSLQGAPYEYGKASPDEGFDCSGFVQHVYATQGVRLPRTVNDMFASLPAVSKSDLQTGDLVFFNIVRNRASHVGLYVQADKFIHAPSSSTGQVQLSSLNNPYWRTRFSGVRRPKRPNP